MKFRIVFPCIFVWVQLPSNFTTRSIVPSSREFIVFFSKSGVLRFDPGDGILVGDQRFSRYLRRADCSVRPASSVLLRLLRFSCSPWVRLQYWAAYCSEDLGELCSLFGLDRYSPFAYVADETNVTLLHPLR